MPPVCCPYFISGQKGDWCHIYINSSDHLVGNVFWLMYICVGRSRVLSLRIVINETDRSPGVQYDLETMGLTEKQQEKVQVYENNWIIKVVRAKIADKRRIDEL